MEVETFLVKVCFDILDVNNMLLKCLSICNYSVITLYFLTRERFLWAGFVWQRHLSAVLEPKQTVNIASADRNSKITAHYLSPLEEEKPWLQGASRLLKLLCSSLKFRVPWPEPQFYTAQRWPQLLKSPLKQTPDFPRRREEDTNH